MFEVKFIRRLHIILGHPGRSKTRSIICAIFAGATLNNTIVNIGKEFDACHKNKSYTQKSCLLQGYIQPREPLQKISTNLFGPFPLADFYRTGNENQLTVSDIFLRYSIVRLMEDTSTRKVLETFDKDWFQRFGLPTELLSDNGPQYTSVFLNPGPSAHYWALALILNDVTIHMKSFTAF